MIQVNDTKTSITVKGHANYDEYGKDIVCSAVSILCLTLVESLKKTNANIEYNLDSGQFYLSKIGLEKNSDILIGSFFIGLDILIEMYPEYITKL